MKFQKKKFISYLLLESHYLGLNSLNKKRYHLLNKEPCSIENFMNSEIEIWKRENLAQKKLKPLLLYEKKIKSYIKL